jgi:hypothetical protein
MRHPSPILFVLPVIAGCALLRTDKGGWSKPDASGEQTASDLGACRDAAHARLAPEERIQQDTGSIPYGQPGPPPPGGSLQSNLSQYDFEKRYDRLVHDCMIGLGYIQGAKGSS